MPVGIVQVMNNTSYTLHYHNLKSGHKIDIGPKPQQYENNNWIPTSSFYDDTIPFRISSHIDVWCDDGPNAEISDHDWRFCIAGPVDGTGERAEIFVGSLVNGGKYMLKLDDVYDGEVKKCAFRFLKYEDRYKVTGTGGYISSRLIQHAAQVGAIVLMAMFL